MKKTKSPTDGLAMLFIELQYPAVLVLPTLVCLFSTYQMNPLQSKPEVVVPPHLYGVPTNAFASETSLLTLSDVDDVLLLEDDEDEAGFELLRLFLSGVI